MAAIFDTRHCCIAVYTQFVVPHSPLGSMTVAAAKYKVVEMMVNKHKRHYGTSPRVFCSVERSIKPVLDVIVCRSSSAGGYNCITQVEQLTREGHCVAVIERTERSAAWATIINSLLG